MVWKVVCDGMIGIDICFFIFYGECFLVYVDYMVFGCVLQQVEDVIGELYVLYVNFYIEDSEIGCVFGWWLCEVEVIICWCINVYLFDVVVICGLGVIGVIYKFQEIFGLVLLFVSVDWICEIEIVECLVVFIGLYEYYFNELSWCESLVEVVFIFLGICGGIDLVVFE